MNWKKFLMGSVAITGLTSVALFYAPAILAAEAAAVIWGTEIGIGALGAWLTCKMWKNSKNSIEKQNVSPETLLLPTQQNIKENQKDRDPKCLKRWIRTPRLISKWRSKNRQVKNENYRDVA